MFVIVGSGSVIGDSLTMDDGDMVMGVDCCALVSVSFLGMVVLFLVITAVISLRVYPRSSHTF